jgi:hypothetical protein
VPVCSRPCALPEAQPANVKMKQYQSRRFILAQILTATPIAPALVVVSRIYAGDELFHVAVDSNEMQFEGHE